MKYLLFISFFLAASITSFAQCNDQPTVNVTNPDCNQDNGMITVTSPLDVVSPIVYTELFISEVTDHTSGTHSYIEIYNATENTIDLSNYEVLVFNNGNTSPSCTENLAGFIPANESIIINLTNAFPQGGITPDFFFTCSGINENDRVALAKNGNIIDEFGYTDGSDLITGKHFSYRRKNDVVAPSTNFDETGDWVFQDWSTDSVDYSDVGSYEEQSATLYTYALLDNPSDTGVFTTDTDFDNLSPGDYYLAYRAYNGSVDPSNLICQTSVTDLTNWGPITLVEVPQPVIPSFDPVPSQCEGTSILPLPTTSNNGITGTWSPAIDNTQTTTYTFTPDAGECAETTTLEIVIEDKEIPTFNAVPPQCEGTSISPLPTTSNNGITGTWSPAIDNTQTTTYTFTPDAGECAETTTLEIVIEEEITPTFDTVPPQCEGTNIPPLPTTSNNGITGTWSPAIDNTQTTTYTFTPNSGECAETTTLEIVIEEEITPIFDTVPPQCEGTNIPPLPTTSNNGITGTWSPAIDNTQTTTYTFTPDAGECAESTTLEIIIEDLETPTFNPVPPQCEGTSISPLPTTSNNGITGTWSPAIDNTQTTTYSFTPDAGECAETTTLEIVIEDKETPTFDAVPPQCEGTSISPLPTTSTNGITGTWSPAIDNTQTTTYTFTPDAGECAETTILEIVIEDKEIPTFNAVPPQCEGTSISPLPTTSNNGITGTWSPAIDNTQTTTYTFTPDAGECAETTTLDIVIEDKDTPTFDAIPPQCEGTSISPLPTTSNNNITGTWSPAIDNTQTTTYTFTPDAGECAVSTTLEIIIQDQETPTFDAVPPQCEGTSISPLPTTSNNGITGTWSPAIDNTQTTTYTFTPDAGECAETTTLEIIIQDKETPTFNAVPPQCEGTSISPLPTTSNNNITGTWSPAIDNTQTTTYTFTPNSGECAETTTLEIVIQDKETPTFNAVPPQCEGTNIPPLPTTSNNGITGSWSPAIDNTQNTTYTFTPDAGECAEITSLTIEVNDSPQINTQIEPLTLCLSESSTDDSFTIDLTQKEQEILASTSSDYFVEYYESQEDFDNNSPIENPMQFVTELGTQEILVEVINPETFCASELSSLNLIINTNPVSELPISTVICINTGNENSANDSVTLDTGLNNADFSFNWFLDGQSLNQNSSEITVNQLGTYKVVITDNDTACSITDFVEVNGSFVPDFEIIRRTPQISNNHLIELVLSGANLGFLEYRINNNSWRDFNSNTENLLIDDLSSGTYTIQLRDKFGCGLMENDISLIGYRSFLTPNNDGYNDTWNISSLKDQSEARIFIFDRYGKLLKSLSPQSDEGWDGTYNGKKLPSQDYWFKLEYTDPVTGNKKTFKSNLTLKR